MTKIFYVEDEPFLAKIVKETLESKSYVVVHVSDGGRATRIFKEGDFDICLLDIMLPNKNGFEIAEEIRLISNDIPIIFLTAKNQTEDLVNGFKVGGNDYIKKPFSIEELIVRIENLLKLSSNKKSLNAETEDVKIGSTYIFSSKKLQLIHKEEVKYLSHKEVLILEALCNNINETTERKEILFKAWGDDSFYNSRNLDVYIRKIRKYLSKDPKVKIITLKGVGYQFLVEEDNL